MKKEEFYFEIMKEIVVNSNVSIELAHTQKYQMNYLMRSIQNGVIECNKLLSRAMTGKPPKVSGHNSNPHPKLLDGPPRT